MTDLSRQIAVAEAEARDAERKVEDLKAQQARLDTELPDGWLFNHAGLPFRKKPVLVRGSREGFRAEYTEIANLDPKATGNHRANCLAWDKTLVSLLWQHLIHLSEQIDGAAGTRGCPRYGRVPTGMMQSDMGEWVHVRDHYRLLKDTVATASDVNGELEKALRDMIAWCEDPEDRRLIGPVLWVLMAAAKDCCGIED